MAAAPTRPSSTTTLAFGQVRRPVALFTATAKPEDVAKFDTAGPNGGRLKAAQIATPAMVEGDGQPKPVAPAPDPGSDAPPRADEAPPQAAGGPLATTPGEYAQQLIEEHTGEVVLPEDVRRGVRLDDGSFVPLDEHLKWIEEQTALEEMDIEAFIDFGQVPRERVIGCYYLGTPAKKTEGWEPWQVAQMLRALYEGMRRTRRAGLVKWTKRSRQSLGVVVPHPRSETLLVLQLAWAADWREAPKRATAIREAEVSERDVDAACDLIGALSGRRADLDAMEDAAIFWRRQLIEDARAGRLEEPEVIEAPEEEPAPDLAGALEASAAAAVAADRD